MPTAFVYGRSIMISFFDVDVKYADFLRKYDAKVPQFNYHSNQKFLCGVVLSVNGIEYYAPVSHNTKPYPTSFLIRHPKTGIPLGSIRFNYMFPATPGMVTRKDFNSVKAQDPKYYDLLLNELAYCRANEPAIHALAAKVYRKGSNPKDYMHQHCCDFKKLEAVCGGYVP